MNEEPSLSPRVEHGLGGREGLGNDNHERLLRVQVVQSPANVHGIDIGQEPQPVQLGLLPPRVLLSLESLPNKKKQANKKKRILTHTKKKKRNEYK